MIRKIALIIGVCLFVLMFRNLGNFLRNIPNFFKPRPGSVLQQASQQTQGLRHKIATLVSPTAALREAELQRSGKSKSPTIQRYQQKQREESQKFFQEYPRGIGDVSGTLSTDNTGGGGEYVAPEAPVESAADRAEREKQQGLQTVFDQVTSLFNQGQISGPFAFDEALAQNALTQQYAPYYAQTFADFMRGVRTRGARGQEDFARLQRELGAEGELTGGRQRRLLELGQEQVGEQLLISPIHFFQVCVQVAGPT